MPDPFRKLIVGPSASGKTTLVETMLKGELRNRFDKVYLIAPTSFQTIWTNVGLAKDRMFDTPDSKTFESIMEEIMEDYEEYTKKKRPYESLVILDDVVGSDLMKINSSLGKHILKMRHYKASLIVCTQLYRGVPRIARVNFSHLYIFNCQNRKEVLTLDEENAGFAEHYPIATEKNYGYLLIDQTKNIKDPKRFIYG